MAGMIETPINDAPNRLSFRPPDAVPTEAPPDPLMQETERAVKEGIGQGEAFPGLGYPMLPVMGAALRQQNSMVNVIDALQRAKDSTRQEGYNPWDDIRGTRFYDQYAGRFISSQSPRDTYAIIAQIMQEEHDHQIGQAAGKAGWVADLLAGTADPTIFIPGGVGIDALKGTTSFGRAALKMGTATFPAFAAQELALQANQQTRPLEESLVNIASGTLLGGIIGGAAVRGMSALERIGATNALDHERILTNDHSGTPQPEQLEQKIFAARAARTPPAVEIPEAMKAWPDEFLSPEIIRAFEVSHSTVNPASIPVSAELAQALRDLGPRFDKDDKLTLEGLQVMQAEAARRERARTGAPEEAGPPISEHLNAATDLVRTTGNASSSFIQRKLGLSGDARDVLMQDLEDAGVVSKADHAGRREVIKSVPEEEAPIIPKQGEAVPMPQAVGAAASDTRTLERAPMFGERTAQALTSMLEQVPGVGPVAGKSLRWLAKKMDSIDPISRILGSESIWGRRFMADLAETVGRFKEHAKGIATTSFGGPAISRTVQNQILIKGHLLHNMLDENWKDLTYGGKENAPFMARERDAFVDPASRPDNMPTYEQFKTEVSHAMRRDDKHEFPQVENAAKWIRQNIIVPAREDAIRAGLFPKDVDVKYADSYLQRIYNVQKMEAEKPQVIKAFTDHLRKDQSEKAAAQERLRPLNDNLTAVKLRIQQMQEAIDRNAATQKTIGARLTERAMEVGRTERRTGALEDRASEYAEQISEIEDFIRSQKDILHDPQQRAELENMQRDVNELRRRDRPMTEAQLRTLEDEEVKSALTGTNRMAAEMLVGRRKMGKAPSFLNWLVANGGFHDAGGDVEAMVGGKNVVGGLINPRGRALDEMGEKIQNEFPGAFPTTEATGHGAPEPNDILNWIGDSTRGREPDWWEQALPIEDRDKLEAGKMAGAMDEMLNRAGVEVKSVKDVGKILRDEFSKSVTLRDLDKIAAEMEAAGQSVPVSILREGKEDEVRVAREDVAKMRQLIAQARAGKAAREARLGSTEVRAGEAQLAEDANKGRFGILVDRLDRHEQRAALLERAKQSAIEVHDDIRDRIEEELLKWEGKSSAGAKAALKARAAGAAEREPTGRRLTGADDAVDDAVKSIIESHRDLSDDELQGHAHELFNRIVGSPNGRLNYDLDDGGPKIGYGKSDFSPNTEARGPLMARTNAMPDVVLEPWLENDIEKVMHAHMRTMIPDTQIAAHFGDVDMSEQFRKIDEEYDALSQAAGDNPDRQTVLAKERKQVIGDLADLRDLVRGTYAYPFFKQNPGLARAAAVAKNYNVLVNMGMSMFSSLQDMAGPMMRWGMLTVMKDAYAPFLNSLMSGGEFHGEAVRQMQLMGIGLEMVKSTRWHGLTDTMANFHPRSRFERTLQYSADKYQFLDGLAPWTDAMKIVGGVTAMRNLADMAERVVAGTHSARDLEILAENNINRPLAEKIVQQYAQHGNDVDGIRLANTGEWTDAEARAAFEGAIQRDVDIGVVTPGLERPTFMSNPTINFMTQFKSYTAGSHQRILIANLQRMDAQVMSGVMFSMGIGMLQYKISKAISGEPTSDNPADWVKEAMSRGNLLGWIEEGNQLVSKGTRGSLDLYRLIGSEKPLSRYAGRSVLDQLLGPTLGKITSAAQLTGSAAKEIEARVTGSGKQEWNESDTHALRRMTAFQNLFWLRRAFDEIESGANNAFGIPMKGQGGGIQLP